jgi:Tol biopolymer transport system component
MPFPTATLKPGPEPTPIPLSPPAKDAAGSILFLSRESNTVKSALNSLNVDLNGIPKSEVSQLSTYEITENFAYPSPDGQNIIFTIDTEGGPVGTILDLKSGKLEPLLHGLHIRAFFNWYPDSKHILVQLDGNDLWLFEINSDQGTPLAQPRLGAIVGAAASPDGKQVIYSHSMGNSLPSELWIVNADGRDAIKLFDIGYEAISFSWSPDGKKIAFFGDGLMLMNSDGTQLYSVSHHPMHIGVEIPAIWSPDSRFLAIDTLQSPSPNSILYDKSNIYLIDAETGVERPLLADGISGNLDPTWSPDGSKVAFVSNRSGATEVWEVNVDGKDLLQLTHNGKIVRFPHWYN